MCDANRSFEHAQDEMLALCERLESIADSLPANVDRQTCLHLARILAPSIARAHRLEEEVLFPAFAAAQTVQIDRKAAVALLRMEHLEEVCGAEELSEVLMSYGQGNPMTNSETTGYMLRGFFSAVRKHIRLEQELYKAATNGPADDNGEITPVKN